MKRRVVAAAVVLGAVLLLGAFAAGAAFAADPPADSTGTTNYYNVFVDKLAAILKVDSKTLAGQISQAQDQTIDQMVADGRITSDQAKFIKDRRAYFQANGGPGGFGPGGCGGPMRGGFGPPFGGTSGTTPWGTPWGTPPWATPTPSQ